MLGLETDFDWTSLSRNSSLIGSTFLWNGQNDFLTENCSRKLDWLGTTRGRVGFVATLDNRLMFYGTGGLAYGGVSRHFEVFDSLNAWTGTATAAAAPASAGPSVPAPNMRSPTISR